MLRPATSVTRSAAHGWIRRAGPLRLVAVLPCPRRLYSTSVQKKMASAPRGICHDGLRIAVEGCGHGALNVMYDAIQRAQEVNNFTVDLLMICGDFQAVRNLTDLQMMSCPAKYRELGDFHEYYSGKRTAPILTLFIGGNHEASSHNAELFHGGWVAPNIYYLGASNVIRIGGLRIGGLSGIYKSHDYGRAHTERLPYYPGEIKSIYHVRSYDVFKLFQVKEPIDVMLSHDWPQGIEHHGDTQQLWACKPFLRRDSEIGELGSPPAMSLLKKMRPRYWFSGHMHVKFAAIVSHGEEELPPAQELWKANSTPTGGGGADELELELDAITAKNPDELELDLDDDTLAIATSENPDELELDLDPTAAKNPDELELDLDDTPAIATSAAMEEEAPPPAKNPDEPGLDDAPRPLPLTATTTVPSSTPSPNHPAHTHFLALDKALPNRSFLQFLTIPFTHPLSLGTARTTLTYDPEFLSITRALNSYPAVSPSAPQDLQSISPDHLSSLIQENRKWVDENIVAKDKLEIPRNFAHTAPAYQHGERAEQCSKEWRSPQMGQFCELLGMENWVWGSEEEWEKKKESIKMNPSTRHDGGGWRGGRGGGRGYGHGHGRGRGRGRGN